MTLRRLFILTLVFLLSAVPAQGVPVQAQEPQRQDLQTPYMLVIDTSGSMGNNTAVTMARDQTRTRLDLAKSSVLGVMHDLSDENPLGIISYPGGGAADSEGCSTGEMIANPRSQEDKRVLSNRVRGLSANGETPTGPALRNAAETLDDTGADHGVIMLFTDGEANCGAAAVCEVAQDIVDKGFDVTVNTVGLDLSEAARSDMDCVARTTGGVFLHSDDPAQLDQMIREAILPELTLDVDMPAVAMRTAGASGSQVPVSVGVGGNGTARDVRATLTLHDAAGDPGAILVTRPVKYFGNLNAGDERGSAFDMRPGSEQTVPSGEYRWTVTATADNARPVTMEGTVSVTDGIDREAFGEVFRDVEHAVVMGDSYASGEGAETDLDGYQEDGVDKWCHRSSNNYGTRLFGEENTTTIACSGAKAVDFIHTNDGHGARPQLDQLEALVADETNPVDAVIMSIGGNDIGFGGVVSSCLTLDLCGQLQTNSEFRTAQDYLPNAQESMVQLGERAKPAVWAALDSVDLSLNGEDGDRPIVVVPYPRIITSADRVSDNAGKGACFPGVDADEVRLLNLLIDSLNTSMDEAVDSLRLQGRPVYYADSVVEALQPNHTICDPDPWVVGTRDWKWDVGGRAVLVLEDRVVDIVNSGNEIVQNLAEESDWMTPGQNYQQLVHPSADGHAAMARSIAAWSATDEARRPVKFGVGEKAPYYNFDPPEAASLFQNAGLQFTEFMYPAVTRGAAAIQNVGTAVDNVLVAGAERFSRVDWEAAVGNALTTTTYLAGSTYWIMLNSEPTMIEVGVVDETGQLPSQVTVPSFVPAGQHTLVAVTVSPEGTTDRLEVPVTVVSAGSYLAVSGLLLGLILLVVGLVGRLVLRRR